MFLETAKSPWIRKVSGNRKNDTEYKFSCRRLKVFWVLHSEGHNITDIHMYNPGECRINCISLSILSFLPCYIYFEIESCIWSNPKTIRFSAQVGLEGAIKTSLGNKLIWDVGQIGSNFQSTDLLNSSYRCAFILKSFIEGRIWADNHVYIHTYTYDTTYIYPHAALVVVVVWDISQSNRYWITTVNYWWFLHSLYRSKRTVATVCCWSANTRRV